MRVVIFGATGMVGKGVLLECIEDARVDHVLVVSRHQSGVASPKVREIIHDDFSSFESLRWQFADLDACFFCLGVSSVGMSEQQYYRLTHDLTLAAARTLESAAGRRLTFCYVSGEGTDSTERGRSNWARVKGKTENELLRMGFRAAYMFRPGYIQPLKGIRSKTGWYQAMYNVVGSLYPVLRRLLPRYVTTTEAIGRAMIAVGADGYSKPILFSPDINAIAAAPAEPRRDRP